MKDLTGAKVLKGERSLFNAFKDTFCVAALDVFYLVYEVLSGGIPN
jgi:hypothetical protein